MVIDRRTLLLAGLASASGLAPRRAVADAGPLFAAARANADGSYSAAIFDVQGRDIASVALPDRGHDIEICPVTRRCVAFARRPGTFAVAFGGGAETVAFGSPDDRHFYGHGVFSLDGRLLYASENDFDAGVGVIGVYDVAKGFARVGEFPSYGVGPHELRFLKHQAILVVANGGYREHPDLGGGRRILNPDAVETSIAYIDPTTGDLIERHHLEAPGQISLRHLDIGEGDVVVIGAQLERPSHEYPSMVFRHRRQKRLEAVVLPAPVEASLDSYVSSMAVDHSGSIATVTSSRGGVAVMIEIATGCVVRRIAMDDVSGVARGQLRREFLLTSGRGTIDLADVDASRSGDTISTTWQWDNHVALVGTGE
jgi:hypothetical protein